MKIIKILLLISIIFFFSKCQQSFLEEDPSKLNQLLKTRNIDNPEEIMEIYQQLNFPDYHIKGLSQNKIKLETKELANQNYEITLIDSYLDGEGDSIAAEKIKMIVKKIAQNKWQVLGIQRSWKCHKERGHTNFGAKQCS